MGANSWVHVVIFRLPKTVRIRRVVFGTCQPVFSEIQKLYCAEGHPLFATPDADLTDDALTAQSFAGYMLNETICGVNFTWAAATPHMEGPLLLLLSGAYIGFLPDHYADEWGRNGRLRVLAPERMTSRICSTSPIRATSLPALPKPWREP